MFTRILLTTLLSGLAGPAIAAPTVFWASDPVQPGQTVVVIGEGFGEKPKVRITRLPVDTADQSPAKDASPNRLRLHNNYSAVFPP